MKNGMIKRTALLLIVLFAAAGGIFAQDRQRAKNALSVSVGVLGAELGYERMFGERFSVLAGASYTRLFIVEEFTASVKGRAYPFGGVFFLDLGLGYTYGRGLVKAVEGAMEDMLLVLLTFGWWSSQIGDVEICKRTSGFLIQPGLGWKIDFGKPDGFILPISMGLDIKLVNLSRDGLDVMPYLRIGVGYAF